ncbi:slit homolog 2 protein [Nilaparvata lugens]|uniref:slit homolog 2 protein n=1 Tax=Nilaparvata lugens TaxID=108931 RepID=UPI00193DAF47|nr:slit homolog 2 protein [Nilaparvata lugens]
MAAGCRLLSCLALMLALPARLTSDERVGRASRGLCHTSRGPITAAQLQCIDLSAKGLSTIPESAKFGTLTHLDLHSNRITVLDNVTLSSNLISLDLSDNELTQIEQILSESLKTLNLSHNNISDIKFLTSLVTLERLDLSMNHIYDLGKSQFATMINLVRLDLSSNSLTNLHEKTFSGLHRLQTLDLSQNQLRVVMLGTFRSLDNLLWLSLARNDGLGAVQTEQDSSVLLGAGRRLQTVDASHTNLVRVPDTLTQSVRDLYLCCNQISAVRCGDMDSFPLLRTLDLSSNKISIVEEDALGRSELLRHLLLAENQLESVPHSLPPYLLVLDLDHNFISNITLEDFAGLSKLRTLRLAWNKVSVVSDEAFSHLAALKNLDLSGNPLKLLSSSTFSGPRWLLNLSLASLTSLQPTNRSLAFPVPESDRLRILNLNYSPVLAKQLLDDTAALSMFRQLDVLSMAYTNLTDIRSDLVNFLPRLKVLDLRGTHLNCTDITWLASWLLKLKSHGSENSEKWQRLDNVETTTIIPLQDNLNINNDGEEDDEDFSIAGNVDQYWQEAYTQTLQKLPVCSYPQNLSGISLLQIITTSTTATLPTIPTIHRLSRYEHQQPEMSFDHDSYQNDFPHFAPSESDDEMTTLQPLFPTTQITRVKEDVMKQKKMKKKKGDVTQEKVRKSIDGEKVTSNGTTQQPFSFGKKKSSGSDTHGGVVTMTKGHKPSTEKPLERRTPMITTTKGTLRSLGGKSSHNDTKVDEKDVEELQQQDPLHSFTWEGQGNENRPEEPNAPQRISVPEESEEEPEDSDKDDEDPVEARYTHHPGLLVLAAAAGLLGAAALAMRASQRRQARRGYSQHEDIEVRSLDPDHERQEVW